MYKKTVSLFLALLTLVLCLSGCGKNAAVKVNGTKIDSEITAYFNASAKEGEDVNALITRYVAVNSEFNNHSLTVPKSTRLELSDDVNNIWQFWGNYYTNLGISKETIYKIELSKVYKTLLLEERYGENGSSPVNENDIKEYFRQNFAAIRFVTGYLFEISENGTTEMAESQKEKLKDSFKDAADVINGGSGFEDAVKILDSAEIHDAVVNSSGADNFPDGFWDEVKKIEINKAGVISLGSYVFLVQRVSAEKGEFECYSQYRSDCLYQMKGQEFEQVVDGWAKNYTVS